MRIKFFSIIEIKERLTAHREEQKTIEELRSEATKTELNIIAEKIIYLLSLSK